MGLLIPAPRFGAQEFSYSGRPTTTWGTTLTAHATPHTEPASKTTIIAATVEEYDLITVEVSETSTSATLTDGLVNIYLGAAASEVILLPNLLAGWAQTINSTGPGYTYTFPVRIPRGSRISGTFRALITVDTVVVRVALFKTGQWAGSGVESCGALTATSRGTQITPGGAAEGTFTALATTANLWRYVLAMQIGNTDVTANVGVMGLDLGVGSALIAGLENFYCTNTSGEIFVPHHDGRYVDVASGTALQARLQSSTTDVEDKSVIAYGVY